MGQPTVETASWTDVGRRRDHNEDNCAVIRPGGDPASVVCVVADGMGGHLAGEIASQRAVETVSGHLGGGPAKPDADGVRQAIESANAAIWSEAQADAAKRGMGTTIVCAVVHGDTVQLANVGDSPAFLVTNGTTRQVTHDHAWVAEQLEMGTLTEEEAARHPFRHVLTRCLGAEDKVEVELYEPFALGDGDALVLCSDGLTEHVQTEEIGKLTREAPSLDAAARALVDLANSRGGVDNITVVIARLAARD